MCSLIQNDSKHSMPSLVYSNVCKKREYICGGGEARRRGWLGAWDPGGGGGGDSSSTYPGCVALNCRGMSPF